MRNSALRRTLSALGSALLAACSSPTDGGQKQQPVITALPRALSADELVAASATTQFGLALFRQVNATTARGQNLTLSPISASLALGMLLNGAEGETLDQVRNTLGFGSRSVAGINAAYGTLVPLLTTIDPSVTMQFANATWFDTRTPPSPVFRQAITTSFDGQVSAVSFQAPSTLTTINAWVAAKTNNRITSILSQLDPATIAMLVNATYFKGNWRAQFDARDTRPGDFFETPNAPVTAQMMETNEGLARTGGLADGTVIAELPYGGDAFVMDVVMPPAGKLESMLDSLTPARWSGMLSALGETALQRRIRMPKFRLEVERELKPALAALGMPRVFLNPQLAPMFAGPAPDAQVSSVVQKVFVDVNEEGTEAAAVTAVVIVELSAGPTGLVIDRPFLFVIRERLTGAILFLGKVVRPVAP